MTRNSLFHAGTLALLAVSVGLAPTVFAADTQKPASFAQQTRHVDVSLGDNGVLIGQILDVKQLPAAAQEVRVRFQDKVVATALTDQNGRFSVHGLRAGTHVVESATGSRTVQLWAPNTAPPSAEPGAVVLSGQGNVVRGQLGGEYGPALRGAIIGGVIVGGSYWALDYNPSGS